MHGADFVDYCVGVLAFDPAHEDPGRGLQFPHKRSRAALALPALLAGPLGIVDGLLVASALSAAALFAGLSLWGRALGGPRLGASAGPAAALLALAMAPLVTLPRHLGTYPVTAAAFVLAAGAGAAALTRPSVGRCFGAGLGAGLCLLIDARGLVWAPAPLLLGALGALRLPGARKLLGGLALAGALGASHRAGAWAYPPHANSLEEQLDVRPLLYKAGARGPAVDPPWTLPSRFVWGRSPLSALPDTARTLGDQRQISRPAASRSINSEQAREAQVLPWLRALAVGAPVAGLALLAARRGWALLALGVSAAPFLVVLHGLSDVVELQPRFFTQALPAVALVLGLAAAPLIELPGRLLGRPGLRWAALYLLLLMVVGRVPGPLGPQAAWRRPFDPAGEELSVAVAPPAHPGGAWERVQTCHDALVADTLAGKSYPIARALPEGPGGPLPAPPATRIQIPRPAHVPAVEGRGTAASRAIGAAQPVTPPR